jgi:hypothetical protein
MIQDLRTLFSIVSLAFTFFFGAVPIAQGDQSPDHWSFNYIESLQKAMKGNSSHATPKKFVGTFYTESTIITYHADGTVQQVVAAMFSDDPSDATNGRKFTPFLGAWKKVGENTIRATHLTFGTEQFGHNYPPDNGVIVKTTWMATFDDAVNGVSPGYTIDNLVSEVFFPGQNPATDEPFAVVEGTGGGRAERLTVD